MINYEKGFDIKPLKKKGKEMCAALEAAGAVLTEKVSYEVVETILRH